MATKIDNEVKADDEGITVTFYGRTAGRQEASKLARVVARNAPAKKGRRIRYAYAAVVAQNSDGPTAVYRYIFTS